jgi:hypothetical protein
MTAIALIATRIYGDFSAIGSIRFIKLSSVGKEKIINSKPIIRESFDSATKASMVLLCLVNKELTMYNSLFDG